MEIEPVADPSGFLDKVCLSVTGVEKAFISDNNGVILAESSAPQDDFSLMVVHSFPKYCERLNKLDLGSLQSLIVEGPTGSFVIVSYENLFLVFLCKQTANFALLTEITNEMKEFLSQITSFVHQ